MIFFSLFIVLCVRAFELWIHFVIIFVSGNRSGMIWYAISRECSCVPHSMEDFRISLGRWKEVWWEWAVGRFKFIYNDWQTIELCTHEYGRIDWNSVSFSGWTRRAPEMRIYKCSFCVDVKWFNFNSVRLFPPFGQETVVFDSHKLEAIFTFSCWASKAFYPRPLIEKMRKSQSKPNKSNEKWHLAKKGATA